MFVPLCRCVCVCNTSVAVCSNLRSQLGALVIIQTLPFAPTLKAFIWRTWNSREPDKASNAACRPKRSGKGEEMHGGIDGIVFLWRFAFTLVLYLLSQTTPENVWSLDSRSPHKKNSFFFFFLSQRTETEKQV